MARPWHLVLFAPLSIACAQVLGYDDLRARTEPAADASADTSTDTFAPDAAPTSARPPARPAGARAPSTKGRTLWLGAKRMYLGTTDTRGETSPVGWRDWGFDIDGRCTTVDDSVKNIGTCRRHPEAAQDALADGDLCRDNNFGRHVIALIKVSSDGFERRINDGILEGNNTWVLRIDDLDDGADDAYAPGRFYRSSEQKDGSVKWDGSDVRSVTSDTLVDRSLDRPKIAFPNGYVANHVWVSGDPDVGEIVLPFSTDLRIPLRSSVLTVQLDPDHSSGKRGTLGAAMPMTALDSVMRPSAEAAGFCAGTMFYESLIRNISRFPDVVIGAPDLQDENVVCDGMSIGIGFDMQAIKPVTQVVDPSPPAPSTCGDAG